MWNRCKGIACQLPNHWKPYWQAFFIGKTLENCGNPSTIDLRRKKEEPFSRIFSNGSTHDDHTTQNVVALLSIGYKVLSINILIICILLENYRLLSYNCMCINHI